MLRRIASAALAACGETVQSFVNNFRYEDAARHHAMRHLFIWRTWIRIGNLLGRNSTPDSEFINREQPAIQQVHIPPEILHEAAEHFYGENTFVAESVADISLFAQVIEPEFLHHVRHLVLEDLVLWRPFGHTRDPNGFTLEDRVLLNLLEHFTGLQKITFNLSWQLEGPHYGNVIRQICMSLPLLRKMEINRPESLGSFPQLSTKAHLLYDDLCGVNLINAELEAKWDCRMDFDEAPGQLISAEIEARRDHTTQFAANALNAEFFERWKRGMNIDGG